MSKLPPISAIRAFEAAARHQNFTRAAEELGLTQAAVSYQIKLLEDRVGMPLFVREARQVTLTKTGRKLSPKVTEALNLLGAAFAEVTAKQRGQLAIAVQPTVAAWLAPRLASFQAERPELLIKLHTSTDLLDFHKDDVDAIVRSGDGNWPDNDVFLLFPMEYAPVCSAEFLQTQNLRDPSDLLGVRRFGSQGWWRRWLTESNVDNIDLGAPMNLMLGMQTMDVALTLRGQGIAMVVPAFFEDDLKSGRLVQPFPHVVRDGRGYFFTYPKTARRSKKIQLFRDWIVAEAELSSAAMANWSSQPLSTA